MTSAAAPLPDRLIPNVLSQHIEDAAFLWLLRAAAVHAPHYSLGDLTRLDGRLEAHLDGLRVAGETGWQQITEELKWEEAGEIFAGASMAFESADAARIDHVLSIASASPQLAAAAVSALGWLEPSAAAPVLKELIGSDDPLVRRIGIAGCAVRRENPGAALADWSSDSEQAVRSRALKAIGELGRIDLLSHCRLALQEESEECRFAGAWSGAILGDHDAVRVLAGFAGAEDPVRSERALRLAARRLPHASAVAWQKQLAAMEAGVRAAVIVAGEIGDPYLVPWLTELMSHDEWARPAGEAFTMITGVDLAFEDMERDAPENVATGPTENPEDEDVALDPDEDLPWPDADLVKAWWSANGARFQPGSRFLVGQVLSPDAAAAVLRTGMQRQRSAAAFELSFSQPGQPLFEVRARGDVQRRLLGV